MIRRTLNVFAVLLLVAAVNVSGFIVACGPYIAGR